MSGAELHEEHHDTGMPHGTKRSYITGFVLAVILTFIPFALVMGGGFASSQLTGIVILVFAIVQILVHMVYFLHMNLKSEGGWIFITLIFTIIVLTIALVGTMWVMYNMNAYMMPGM